MMRSIYGHNFQWQHKRSIAANDAMLMRYRFRVGLSRQWPPGSYQPQKATGDTP